MLTKYSNKESDPLYKLVGDGKYQRAIETATPRLRKLIETHGLDVSGLSFKLDGGIVEAFCDKAVLVCDDIMDYCTEFNFMARDHFVFVLLSERYKGQEGVLKLL